MLARTRPPRGPWPLLAVVALALAGLGGWLLVAEARAVRAGLAEGLRGRAAEAKAAVESQAAQLARGVARREGALVDAEGRFLEPPEPRPMPRLAALAPHDAQASWLLALAGESERPGGDPEEALRLYRAARDTAREPAARALADAGLAAFHRRRGEAVAARRANADLLDALAGDRADGRALETTAEALLARALDTDDPQTLRDDLLASLGTPDEPIALGLLHQAGIDAEAAIDARRAELARMAALRPSVPRALAAESGLALAGGTLVAWQREEKGATRLAAAPVPPQGDGVRLVAPGDELESGDALVELASLGALFPGTTVAAVLPRAAVRRAVRARVALLGAGLLLVACAIGAALLATWRGVRRERAAAAQQTAFLARVGHDLRTPLSVIRMYAETLEAERVDDPAERRAFAGVVAREAARLGGMVGSVLDLARTATPAALRRDPLDLAALARETVEAHALLCRAAGVAARCEAPEDPVPVRGDGDALRGALGNLIENCVHHAAAGGECTVTVERAGDRALLAVLDRGPGLAPELGPRAFERFVRGAGSRSRGAGLGLALVREVVQAHGGTVVAEPREEGGTRVRLSLPLDAAPRDAAGPGGSAT